MHQPVVSPTRVLDPAPDVVPVQKLKGRVAGIYTVPQGNRVESVSVPSLRLDFEGPAGDRHFGFTRASTSREPWYPRGTEISNTRQVSILSTEELSEVAARMDVAELKPEWIGGTLVIDGVHRLSFLPLGTRIFFDGDASLVVMEQNGPCRIAGAAIARHFPERPELELEFPKVARGMRGLVGAVERPGIVRTGTEVAIRVPEQWIYRA
jgi:hypothetical protein